jgi:PhnB protein
LRIDTIDLTIIVQSRYREIHSAQYSSVGEVIMAQHVEPTPEGFRSLTPFLVVQDGAAAIAFYKQVFGAVEDSRLSMPDGKIAHATLTIGSSKLMLCDEFDYSPCRSPHSVGGSTVTVHLYTEDVDATFARVVAAGAAVTMAIADTMWGDRLGTVRDPFGHCWSIATHKRDMSESEIKAAFEAALAKPRAWSRKI